jgi:hypothetical protein
LLRQQLAKRAASNAVSIEEDKLMVNGDSVAPSTADDVSNSTPIDQTPAPPNVEAEPAPQVEAKVREEICSAADCI